MKRVLVPLAPGFEEIEVVSIVDILRRVGTEVVVAGTVDGAITGANGMQMFADTALEEVWMEDFDMIILPGGNEGTENLKKDDRVLELVRAHNSGGKFVSAICAAPTVLKEAGVIDGKRITSYPSVADEFDAACYSEETCGGRRQAYNKAGGRARLLSSP